MKKRLWTALLCVMLFTMTGCNTTNNADIKVSNCGYMACGSSYMIQFQDEEGNQYYLTLNEDGIHDQLGEVISVQEQQELTAIYKELNESENRLEIVEKYINQYIELADKYNIELHK